MFNKTTLDNGLRVVCERIPYVRSISLGVWIGTGSRNEDKSNNGISHFIEHMMFKGTEKRTAKEIAESIDSIGGQLNAFTGKECTCYYIKTLDTHIETGIEVLADMLFNSVFAPKDINVERKVILEEIGMYEDSPEELVHDILSETVWQGNSLGFPILGTQESLKTIDSDAIKGYLSKNYLPSNAVIAVSGNFEYDNVIAVLNNYFGKWESELTSTDQLVSANFVSNSKFREKDTEQVHICMGFKGIEHGRDELYSLLAVNNIFGGGMSSRLFQKIREEMGLAYSVYSYPSSYKKSGLFTIYSGMNPEQLEKVTQLIIEEIYRLKSYGISSDELHKSKEQLKGSYILGLESTSSRMNSIGKSELLLGKIYSPEEILKKIERIDMEGVQKVIERIFNFESMSFAAVGNIKKHIDIKQYLQ